MTQPEELNAALKEIYEIWAGSEGIPLPKTAPEAYLLGLVEQMRDIARDALASASTKPKYLSWQHAKWCASFGIPDDPNAKRPDCDCFMQRMEKIPVDRSVVQQALHLAMAAEHPKKLIAALRAALAEDAMQKFTDVNQELEAALAEPVQEPYAWMAVGGTIWRHKTSEDDVPLYTAPRVPLAEWQINDLMADIDPEDRDSWSFRQGVYAAEKHHGVRK